MQNLHGSPRGERVETVRALAHVLAVRAEPEAVSGVQARDRRDRANVRLVVTNFGGVSSRSARRRGVAPGSPTCTYLLVY